MINCSEVAYEDEKIMDHLHKQDDWSLDSILVTQTHKSKDSSEVHSIPLIVPQQLEWIE